MRPGSTRPLSVGTQIVLRCTIVAAMTAGSSPPRDLALNRSEPVLGSLSPPARRFLAMVGLGALALLSPASLQSWTYVDEALLPVHLNAPSQPASVPTGMDLDGDGRPETLDLTSGILTILSNGSPRWQSPATWSVRQAAFTELNRDGRPEVSLLVWRQFRPWPTDILLPHAGRIDSFHDSLGQSCHLILVGSDGSGGYRELWAGSALADPIMGFAAIDLDGDDRQDLLTLENRYTDDPSEARGRSLKVWEWNGFGFTAMDSVDRNISKFVVVHTDAYPQIIAQTIR
jgi:hypothetical protein